MRRAETRSVQEARESALTARGRAGLSPLGTGAVYRPEWRDRAEADRTGHTYQAARAWENEDHPEAVRAEQRMRENYATGTASTWRTPRPIPAVVGEAVASAEVLRQGADVEHNHQDTAEAHQLMTEAEQADRNAEAARAAAEHEPDPAERDRASRGRDRASARVDGCATYGNAERREAMAQGLESRGIDHETVATRMRADVSQAKPATEATKTDASTKAPKARSTRGRAPQVQRTGLDR